jgi:ribosomal protein S27AE
MDKTSTNNQNPATIPSDLQQLLDACPKVEDMDLSNLEKAVKETKNPATTEHPKCPRCNELLVHPRDSKSYCEECGWPYEDFDETD